jgi:hypothetical protein
MIKESYSKKRSLKDLFLKKGGNDSNNGSYVNAKYLKDPLI